MVSTKNTPCNEYPQLTCINREFYLRAAERYHCQITFLYNDTFLNDIRRNDLPLCNRKSFNKIHKEIMRKDFNQVFNEMCKTKQPCLSEIYSVKVDESFYRTYNYTKTGAKVRIAFSGSVISQADSYISYDLQSLISELGGNLGLTLGFSGLSLIQLFSNFFTK